NPGCPEGQVCCIPDMSCTNAGGKCFYSRSKTCSYGVRVPSGDNECAVAHRDSARVDRTSAYDYICCGIDPTDKSCDDLGGVCKTSGCTYVLSAGNSQCGGAITGSYCCRPTTCRDAGGKCIYTTCRLADFDNDGDVDQTDAKLIQMCESPVLPVEKECIPADINGDTLVDNADMNFFNYCLNSYLYEKRAYYMSCSEHYAPGDEECELIGSLTFDKQICCTGAYS
ncbi:MAG: hypothetical protein JXB14_02870, partial [Candidatus Altiarchaeota archaeon]|nr:hypothetical protein [Candidatus Altiarchaeota archaeon]